MLGLLVAQKDSFTVREFIRSLDLGIKSHRVMKYSKEGTSGCLIPVQHKLLDLFVLDEIVGEWSVYCSNSELFSKEVKYWFREAVFPSSKCADRDYVNVLGQRLRQHFGDIPTLDFTKYELYDNCLILPDYSLLSEKWKYWFTKNPENISFLFEIVSQVFETSLILRKTKISNTIMRLPKHEVLYYKRYLPAGILPDNEAEPIISITQNSIKYTWNPIRTMFSAGNIPEKIRMSKLQCKDETILDLYAGIGYWSLPLLVCAKAKFVFACEMNPYSVEALRRNFVLNKVPESKYIMLEGDHANFADIYQNKADRVILGYLPSSERGWEFATIGLNSNGGILHIHQNVEENEENNFKSYLNERLLLLLETKKGGRWCVDIVHIQRVKSFGPRVNHLVFDVKCRPQ